MPSRRRAGDRAHQVHDVGVALHLHELGDPDAAGGAHPAEVVASEVDEHEVLGLLLLAPPQLRLELDVALRGGPAAAGAGDRVVLDVAPGDPDEHLGRGADDRAAGSGEIEHVRARVDRAQRPVEVEGRDPQRQREAAADLHLEDVAGEDVLAAAEHAAHEVLAAEVGERLAVVDRRRLRGERRRGRERPAQPLAELAEPAHRAGVGGVDVGAAAGVRVGDEQHPVERVVEDDHRVDRPRTSPGGCRAGRTGRRGRARSGSPPRRRGSRRRRRGRGRRRPRAGRPAPRRRRARRPRAGRCTPRSGCPPAR